MTIQLQPAATATGVTNGSIDVRPTLDKDPLPDGSRRWYRPVPAPSVSAPGGPHRRHDAATASHVAQATAQRRCHRPGSSSDMPFPSFADVRAATKDAAGPSARESREGDLASACRRADASSRSIATTEACRIVRSPDGPPRRGPRRG